MKVCFFDFTINFGGAPQGSLYLMQRLQEAGHECYIIDAYGTSEEYITTAKDYGLRYYTLYPNDSKVTIGYKDKPVKRVINALSQLGTLSKVTKALFFKLKEIKPNVVIVNNEKSLFFLNIASYFLEFKKILYFRGEGIKSQLSRRFIKSLNANTDHVVAHSKLAISNLEKAGVAKKKLSYIPNCIEIDKFKTPEQSSDISSSKRLKIILPAARPVREKGYHIAIEAVNILVNEGYDIDLFLPGKRATGDNNEYKDYLKFLIKSYDLEANIHFIGWRNNLISDITACDLVVLPSHTEGFPRSIIEAMIHGVPVCATPVGGIPEAIKHMKTGMLFDVDDTHKLVENIKLLIDNPNIYDAISKNAREFSRKYFNPQNNTDGMLDILNKI